MKGSEIALRSLSLSLCIPLSPFTCFRFSDPAALSGEGETGQGMAELPLPAEGGRAPVLPLHQALPHLHTYLGGQATPAQGESSRSGGQPRQQLQKLCVTVMLNCYSSAMHAGSILDFSVLY